MSGSELGHDARLGDGDAGVHEPRAGGRRARPSAQVPTSSASAPRSTPCSSATLRSQQGAGRTPRERLQGDFRTPRSLNKSIPALEAICLKAMARYSGDRYPTAAALATDIERWLADEPVLAYPEPWTSRLARWARRHRTAVAARSPPAHRLFGPRDQHLPDRSREGQDRAELPAGPIRRREDAHRGRRGRPGRRPPDGAGPPRVAGEGPGLLSRVPRRARSHSSIRLENGRALGRLGDIDEMLGLYVQAESSYRDALKLLSASTSDVEIRRALARARNNLGILLKKSNRFAESEAFLREALVKRRALAKLDPKNDEDTRAVSSTLYQLGTVLARAQGSLEGRRSLLSRGHQGPGSPRRQADEHRRGSPTACPIPQQSGHPPSGSDLNAAQTTFLRAAESRLVWRRNR